jgi:cobalt transporter subunit CbtB
MEKSATQAVTWSLPEQVSFFLKSGVFLLCCSAILYVALASEYPAVHDALHNVRHALAVVPCH